MDQPTAPPESPLLITGCYRSGTTLLEKVLNQHRDLAVASQPFPVLYALLKEKFLLQRELQRRYPLGHLFLESDYTSDEFHAFLDHYTITPEDLDEFFDQMDRYDEGLWTPEMREARGELRAGTFWDVYQQLMAFLQQRFHHAEVQYRGTKEVLVEEYAPYFAVRGAAVIFCVRDPRAMIASLNFRERDNLTGENRPILFSLRAWRKSIAIALTLVKSPNVSLVRYEDLVLETSSTLSKLAGNLRISPFGNSVLSGEIIDQHGRPWHGNSSFGARSGISNRSVDAWREKLPREVVEYIETVCLPEMHLLGYQPERCHRFDPDIVRQFRDPWPKLHAKFPADYSCDPKRAEDEIRRFELLTENPNPSEQRRWFVHEEAYARLRKGIPACL